LSQFHLKIPPLRERPEDIVALADYFLHSLAPEKRFSRQAKDRLLAYYWPGNIRELESVVLQAGTFREELEIGADCLSLEKELAPEQVDFGASARDAQAVETGHGVDDSPAAQDTLRQAGPQDLCSLERQAIIDTLAKAAGHQGITALELGISRRTLSRTLKLYNIDPARPQGRSQVAELGGEQQLRFRYSLEIPVSIAAAGKHFLFKSRNISCGGVCLQGAQKLPKNTGNLSISFELPGCNNPIEAKGRIVWADPEGTVGVRFTTAPQHSQIILNQWLKQKQEVEGWL